MRVTPIEKQSKKNQKEFYKKQRAFNGFNTGTRDMGKTKNELFDEIMKEEIKKYEG